MSASPNLPASRPRPATRGRRASRQRSLEGGARHALDEPALTSLEAELADRLDERPRWARETPTRPTSRPARRWQGCAGRPCVRALHPEVVVETGVAAGYTSAHIAAALEENGRGELHSIDPVHGWPRVRGRRSAGWCRTAFGTGRRFTGAAAGACSGRSCAGCPPVGVFVHDGLHTEPTMRWELRTVTSSLAPRSRRAHGRRGAERRFRRLGSCQRGPASGASSRRNSTATGAAWRSWTASARPARHAA